MALNSLLVLMCRSETTHSHSACYTVPINLHCLLSVTWTLSTDSAMQKHSNCDKHEPRDLEDRLFLAVSLITSSSYVISW